jgi:hypothetical protein
MLSSEQQARLVKIEFSCFDCIKDPEVGEMQMCDASTAT